MGALGGCGLACVLAGTPFPVISDFFCTGLGGGGGFLQIDGDGCSPEVLSGAAGLRAAGAAFCVAGPLPGGRGLGWVLVPGTGCTFLVGAIPALGP